jgi:hypothetical protein
VFVEQVGGGREAVPQRRLASGVELVHRLLEGGTVLGEVAPQHGLAGE